MNDKKDQSGFRWNIYDEDRHMSHKYESRSPESLDRPPESLDRPPERLDRPPERLDRPSERLDRPSESLDDLIRKIWLLCVICIPIITVSVAFIAYFYLKISNGMNSLVEEFGR